MPFEPGHQKIGGRKPGTPNKKTQLINKCEAKGIDVFDEMLSIAVTTTDLKERFYMFKEIICYLYPRQREVTMTLEDYSDEQFDAEVERRINERRTPGKISER